MIQRGLEGNEIINLYYCIDRVKCIFTKNQDSQHILIVLASVIYFCALGDNFLESFKVVW